MSRKLQIRSLIQGPASVGASSGESRVSEVGRGALVRCRGLQGGVLRQAPCSGTADGGPGRCQAARRISIQAPAGGVVSHSWSEFPGQVKAAYLVVERAHVLPSTLLSKQSTLHVERAGRAMPCQEGQVRIEWFQQKRGTVTRDDRVLGVKLPFVSRDGHASSEKTADSPRIVVAG